MVYDADTDTLKWVTAKEDEGKVAFRFTVIQWNGAVYLFEERDIAALTLFFNMHSTGVDMKLFDSFIVTRPDAPVAHIEKYVIV